MAGCAKIYAATAGSLLRDPALPVSVSVILEEGLAKAGAGDTPDAEAWALRHALDTALALVGTSAVQDSPPVVLAYPVAAAAQPAAAASSSTIQATEQPPLRTAIQQAIAAGVPVWNRGDYAGCARIYRAVAEQYAEVEPRLHAAVERCEGAPLDASSGSQGWILRRAFDAVSALAR